MNLRIYATILVSFGLLCTLSCSNNNTSTSTEQSPQRLNDKAMETLYNAKDTHEVLSALYFLDQAIALDSNFAPAHINKIHTLLQLGEVDKALASVKKLNTLGNFPEYIMFEGFIYDRHLSDSAKANQQYTDAMKAFDAQYAETKDSTLLFNKGFTVLMLNGKEAGINYYNSLAKQFPNNDLLKSMLQQAQDFDKRQFLLNLW